MPALSDLFSAKTAKQWLAIGLAEAQSLGLLTSSWRTGDPTNTTYNFLARALATRDGVIAEYIKAGFLSSATGDWLTIYAHEVYGVDRILATYAPATVTITNTGGGVWPIGANDLTFKNSITGKTYHNVADEPTLNPGGTLTIDVEADEAGSNSSASANEIDELVTSLLGVSVVSSTLAVGIDEESDADLRARCEASRGAVSPDGPPDAYEYVALSPEKTGVSDVTRAATVSDATTGVVDLYVASSAGLVSGPSLVAVQTAIERWATPLCILPTARHATAVTINVTATISGANIPGDAAAQISDELGELFAKQPIAKTISGYSFDPTLITTAMRNRIPGIVLISSFLPSAPVTINIGRFPVLGTVSITVVP